MTTHKHPLPTAWPTLLLAIAVMVALMAMVGGCFGAVEFCWNPSQNTDGYWLMSVGYGKTNLLAATSATNAVANWNGATAFVVATNRFGAVSKPSNLITNTPLPPSNLKRK